jgi:hypothetical protein
MFHFVLLFLCNTICFLQGESCSLFPDEMDCYFGDSILYKVQRDCSVLDEKIPHFKVISICNEVAVVDKFIDDYLSSDENIDPVY